MCQIKTHRGILFNPLNPAPKDIDIVDISHALSMLCRANGHFPVFYSVAQHSINCRKEALARGYSHRVQLACLLHDASEAYLSDVTRPVKAELPKYLEIEKPLQNVIWSKWIQPALTDEELRLVFQIDDAMLCHEFLALMNERLFPVIPELKSHPTFDFSDFSQVEEAFLLSFHQLIGADNIQQRQPNMTDAIEHLRTQLLESKKYYFDSLLPSALEEGLPVVYAIFNKYTGETLYVGRTKNLRRRLYTNHLMGPETNARLKKYLVADPNEPLIKTMKEAKNYLREKCYFQYIAEPDTRKRGQLEGLLSYILNVRYIHEEH